MNSVVPAEKKSVLVDMATRYGMEPTAFAATLKATVVPEKTSNEQFAAFLLVCKEYDLNPILKEIYAFPNRSGGIQPIVSVDGWANLINSHPAFDGMEFDDALTDKGDLVSVTCRMYRKDRSRPVTATEYMVECRRNTDVWRQWPKRMLRHKAMIQAARYAFGFAGIVDPDEWERSPESAPVVAVRAPAPPAPEPAMIEHKPEPVQAEEVLEVNYAELADGIIARMTSANAEEVWEYEVGAIDWPKAEQLRLDAAFDKVTRLT